MKKTFLALSLLTLLAACKNNDKKIEKADPLSIEEKAKAMADTVNYTSIQWLDAKEKDLGKLTHDQSIELSFRFKNTGDKNLIFENVWAQCGCTIPEKPEKPVAPGEEGLIKAKFNGSGSGVINKAIYIKANIKPDANDTLHFTGHFEETK
ncbi:MAG: DUF1573 domain-containing protein [Chitinophagaceae bacterium]|nr:DUF1573 domain-containing protein [Chitinophagaceae bacterium]